MGRRWLTPSLCLHSYLSIARATLKLLRVIFIAWLILIRIFSRLIDKDRLAREYPNVMRGLDRWERLRRVDVSIRRKRMDCTLMLLVVVDAILSASLLHHSLLLAYVRHDH